MNGNLHIGNEWEAITIIARSQPNPLKAVAELVENSVDAGAKEILIIRGKKNGVPFLSILDNGEGLHLNAENEPDFHHVATHICDSMKRRLSVAERRGIQGEFGTGLLGFWTLGRELHMVARNGEGKLREMVMREGEQSFSTGPATVADLEEMLKEERGVEVTVSHLHSTTKHYLTGEKLQRFLALELRDRIRLGALNIVIRDRIARKELQVVPHVFCGERVARVQKISVPGFGAATAELYLNLAEDRLEHRVWVARNGTRLTEDIRTLPGCDREPWSRGVFEGVIDFPGLQPAPGARQGVVQNAAFTAFLQELEAVANDLEDLLNRRTRLTRIEVNRTVAREVRKALTRAMNTLPEEEYPQFNTQRDRDRAEPLVEAVRREADRAGGVAEVGGELAVVRVRPGHPWIPVNQERKVSLLALDEGQRPASGRLTYGWEVVEGPGRLTRTSGNQAHILGLEPGKVTSKGEVSDGKRTLTVVFTATVGEVNRSLGDRGKLPFYELVPDARGTWRSRYARDRNAILINSSHPDFLWSQANSNRQKRYLTMLYCKELVFWSHPEVDPETLLDRFVQISSRIGSN